VSNDLNTTTKKLFSGWGYLVVILMLALCLRLAGIWRTEPIDYYPDEDKIARPVFFIAHNGQIGLKRDYNWPMCGIIYPLGYVLYALKGWLGPYSYNSILIIQRVISALVGTAVVFVVFLLMRKICSSKIALIAASLVAIAKLPVRLDHEGYIRSAVSLVIITVMLLSYDLFEVHRDRDHSHLKTGKCCVLGFLCGWGVALRWTVLLAAIPISGALFLSIWFNRKTGQWKHFTKTNIQRIAIIAAIAVISFLAGNPDFQLAPGKVISGLTLQMRQGKVGHYGRFSDRSNSLTYKLSSVSKNMSNCGSIYLFIPGILATIFCLARPTRPRVFFLWTMIIWLIVLHRSVVPYEKYHLMPFIIMLLLISIGLAVAMENPKRWLRLTSFIVYGLIIVMGCLYTLIWISPHWKTDARLQCSRWIKTNIPRGSGIVWAPRTHKWMLPGGVVDPSLFRMYPRKAEPGKVQYIMGAHKIMDAFKEHPPYEPVDPCDWFPSEPPTKNQLILYHEMNNGGGPNLTLIKEFYTKPSFLGLDLRLFGLKAIQDTTYASQGVSLFRVNTQNKK